MSQTPKSNEIPTLQDSSGSSYIRESMRTLPSSLQPFLTWLTAKPFLGQTPTNHTSIYHLVTALLFLIIGVALNILAVIKSSL